MKNRYVWIVEGSSDRLEQILALFEAGEFDDTTAIKILDISIAKFDRSEIESVDLYRVWLDSLWQKGFQPMLRSIQATSTNKKIIEFQNTSIEILITVVPLANLAEIQILLQIRPVDGKGYLPAGLKVAILDEVEGAIVEQTTRDRSNLLDLTENGDLICQLEDYFKLELTLGDESIVESFPA